MDRNSKIKVIKKAAQEEKPKAVVRKAELKRNTAREVVSTVKNWVNDFQMKKREETKVALDLFVRVKQQPSES